MVGSFDNFLDFALESRSSLEVGPAGRKGLVYRFAGCQYSGHS